MTRSSQDPTETSFPTAPPVDEGGDPACWAHRVCPECGLLNEAEHPLRCERCGASY